MKDFLGPPFGLRTELELRMTIRKLYAKHSLGRRHTLHGPEGNLQAKVAAEEERLRFEQGLAQRHLPTEANCALHLLSHGEPPRTRRNLCRAGGRVWGSPSTMSNSSATRGRILPSDLQRT